MNRVDLNRHLLYRPILPDLLPILAKERSDRALAADTKFSTAAKDPTRLTARRARELPTLVDSITDSSMTSLKSKAYRHSPCINSLM